MRTAPLQSLPLAQRKMALCVALTAVLTASQPARAEAESSVPQPPAENSRTPLRRHLNSWLLQVDLGYSTLSARASQEALHGMSSRGGFTIGFTGQLSLLMFGLDTTVYFLADERPAAYDTTGGRLSSDVTSDATAFFFGPSLPVATIGSASAPAVTFYLGAYTGRSGAQAGRAVCDCIDCPGATWHLSGGWFVEPNAFVRFGWCGASVGYRYFLESERDLRSPVLFKAFLYVGPGRLF